MIRKIGLLFLVIAITTSSAMAALKIAPFAAIYNGSGENLIGVGAAMDIPVEDMPFVPRVEVGFLSGTGYSVIPILFSASYYLPDTPQVYFGGGLGLALINVTGGGSVNGTDLTGYAGYEGKIDKNNKFFVQGGVDILSASGTNVNAISIKGGVRFELQ